MNMKMKLVKKELMHQGFFNQKNKTIPGTEELKIGEIYNVIYFPKSYNYGARIKIFLNETKEWLTITEPLNLIGSDRLLHLFEPV